MKKFLFAALSAFGLFAHTAEASHGVAFDLQYEPVAADSMRIILKYYRDCAGIQAPTSPSINIASCAGNLNAVLTNTIAAQPVYVVSAPYQNQTTCTSGNYPGIQYFQYETVIWVDTTCNSYTISYEECCRNAAITNLANNGGVTFHVSAWFNPTVRNNGQMNHSVNLTTAPVPYMCNQQAFTYNHGAIDAEGDSLVFSNQTPLDMNGAPATYTSPYTVSNPFATVSGYNQDPMTGQIDFTPDGLQVVAVSMLVEEFRNGVLIGNTMRDMQMYVYNCDTNQNIVLRPNIQINGAMTTFSPNANGIGGVFKVAQGVSFSFMQEAEDGNANQTITASSNIGRVFANGSYVATNGNPASIMVNVPALPAGQKRAYFTTTFEDNANPIPSRSTTGFVVEEDVRLSVNEPTAAAFAVKISPNPASQFVQVSLSGLKGDKTYIQLMDLNGKVLLSQQISQFNPQHELFMQLPNVPNGLYILQIRNANQTSSQKINVQR